MICDFMLVFFFLDLIMELFFFVRVAVFYNLFLKLESRVVFGWVAEIFVVVYFEFW